MNWLWGVLGALLVGAVLWDAFETVVLPRRVTRRLRLTWLFYKFSWPPFAALGRRIKATGRRENYLGLYGPLSLLLLLASWAICLVVGFALLQLGRAAPMNTPEGVKVPDFGSDLYMSGITFFTLGFGDITPRAEAGRLIAVTEGGIGFAFLGLVIGYVPVLYSAFSRREVNISMLDARAGSPPSAAELLRRYCHNMTHEAKIRALGQFLSDWERWSAELLESQLSYPMLCYFRSLHENQSWLEGLTMVLDTCALLMSAEESPLMSQAGLTFAMARHAAVDLSQVLSTAPLLEEVDRLNEAEFNRLRQFLNTEGLTLLENPAAMQKLRQIRAKYEPFVQTLSEHLLMPLPAWLPLSDAKDNWQTTAWKEFNAGQLQ